MNIVALLFFAVNAIALLCVPAKWAPVPLLVACCYMTVGQGIVIGGINLPVYRMLLAVGVIRVLVKNERIAGDLNGTDKLMLWWSGWTFFASFFHEFAEGSGPIYASGMVFNIALVYFLIRIWCKDLTQIRALAVIVAVLLAPVAVEMVFEKLTRRNLFAVFGGVNFEVMIREGKLRASGPFRHPILAGTVGGTCFPLMFILWNNRRLLALAGMFSCTVIVFASASSGPLMSWMAGILAVALWRHRAWTKQMRILCILAYVLYDAFSRLPGYYIIAKIDLTGGSTGRHRAELIESAINHLSEWWLFGTDYTRHWMRTGVSFSTKHTDITNYYLGFGVLGGLPGMLLMIAMVWSAFHAVGVAIRHLPEDDVRQKFMIWCLGAGMLAHAATSISVAYFDQSMIFFWLNVALISSVSSLARQADVSYVSESSDSDAQTITNRCESSFPC